MHPTSSAPTRLRPRRALPGLVPDPDVAPPRQRWAQLALAAAAVLGPGPAGALDALQACAGTADDAQRLACYDRLAREALAGRAASIAPPAAGTEAAPSPDEPPRTAARPPGGRAPATESTLTRHWELTPQTERTALRLRAHEPNYALPAYYSTSPNRAPLAPLLDGAVASGRPIGRTELLFQLSFKLKLAQDLLGSRADLWLGYTQQSHWQAYNKALSSPFRETNYQPELMLVIPTRYDLLGLQGRFVNLGFVHQSNGRGEPLSRSWNRVYAQFGLERGGFSMLLRPWYRIRETRSKDDNPDITDYLGHGDLLMTYRWRGHRFSGLVRRNFSTDRGSVRLDWAFPLSGSVKGYLQAFSGYGASLIDYNHRQSTVGIGVLVDD